MQRVRIGLTGLGFVFVLVLLAAIFTRVDDGEEPITANLIEQRRAPGGGAESAERDPPPKEPLAELGVAPGNVEANSSSGKAGPPANPQQQR